MSSPTRARLRACLALLLVVPAFVAARTPAGSQPAPPRIVAVGDIHGDYDALRAILHEAGLVDDAGRWTGGDTVLVQTGDYTDRGEKVREVLDFLMALETKARAAGGRVEVLLGNHEAMNLIGMLKDVEPRAYKRFVDDRSEERRAAAYEKTVSLAKARASEIAMAGDRELTVPPVYHPPSREEWMEAHPPGMIEYVEALGPKGTYGRWLRSRPAMLRVGDTLFVHGGINPDFAPKSADAANDQLKREIERWDDVQELLVARKAALPFFTFNDMLQAARSTLQLSLATSSIGDAVTIAPGVRQLDDLNRIGTWYLLNPNGPLWFRGFATWTSEEGRPRVDELAKRYKVARFVVGHTMLKSLRITPRFDDRVYLIDTGMLASYYHGGRASALEIRGDRVTAIYGDGRMTLSEGDTEAQRAGAQ